MCGIAGFFGTDNLPKNLHKASSLLAHRGPDGEGTERRTFSGKNGTPMSVEFAHRRLSIVDLSEQGKQPFKDKKGRMLIFNGEIFNWKALRQELESEGYVFASHTDTEVILAGYDRWKFKVFERLNGFWALGLYDPRTKNGPNLILSRDRSGIKPLYYMTTTCGDQTGIYFSSEINSLLALSQTAPEVIPYKVVEFTVKGSLSKDGDTIYKNIYEFPIACYGIYQQYQAKLKFSRYWALPTQSEKITNEKYALDMFSELFEDAIDLWMHADVPVGITLSSGIDSSAIAVAAARKGYSNITAFSSHFPNSPLDEYELAAELSRKLGMHHVAVIPDFYNLTSEVSKFSLHQEMLFTSFSQFVAYCVYREIHKHGYKAFLAGQGGDELYLGYQRHLSSYIRQHNNNETSFLRRLLHTHKNSTLSWFEILGHLAYFSSDRIRRQRIRARAGRIFHPRYVDEGITGALKPSPPDLERLQYSETFGVSQLRRLLRYDDRSASAFGLEGRPVFLDYRLIEFAFKLSPCLLIKNGWTKYIVRKYLDKHGHSNIAWRKRKLGFPAPNTKWSELWLNSNWESSKKQKALQHILTPVLNLETLGSWEKLSLSIITMTASEMKWQL